MTRSVLLSLAGTLALAACHVSARVDPEKIESAEPAIRTVLDSTAAGWNRGDLAPYMAAYSADATAGGTNGFVRGPTAIEDGMRRGFWRTGRPLQSLSYQHLEVRMLGANDALVTGQYVLTGNNQPDRTGYFTTVWEKRPEGWRMIHDHS
jgi:ketosteroid isomerase-like protein